MNRGLVTTLAGALGLVGAALAPGDAGAEPAKWNLELATGAEYDSNVHRCETDGDGNLIDSSCRVAGAPLGRGALSLGTRWRPTKKQRVRFDGLLGTKLYGPGEASPGDENVGIVSADARLEQVLGDRGALLGVRGSFYNTSHIGPEPIAVEPRNFTFGGGDAVISLFGPEQHQIVVSAGYRRFLYKADERFDWQGDRYGLRFQTARWLGDPDEDLDASSIDIAVSYDVQRRYYDRDPTGFRRVDLFHKVSAQAAYTGERIYSASYELQVTDSNTFGFSFVRQRAQLGVTAELLSGLFVTGELTLQLDLFLDSVFLQDSEMETIDDENRNSLSVHLSRALSESWSGELRYALYLNELSDSVRSYQRHIAYLGLVYEYAP